MNKTIKSLPWQIIPIIWVFIAVTVMPFSPAIQAAWIVGLTITFWATAVLPQWFTALLFFVLCAVSKIAPPQIFLSGMFSPAMWLLIAGSIIGLSIQHTGMGNRLANFIVPLMTTYKRALLGSALIGFVFLFLMPSTMGRVIMLLPIMSPLTEQLGYKDNTHAKNGILLSAVLVTFLPAFTVLPANVPNNVLLGLVKTLFSDTPTYGGYLLLHFPILGVMKTVLIIALLIRLYQAPDPTPIKQDLPKLSPQEKYLLAILLMTLSLWVSESLHGISTAWVAMIGAMLCLYPTCQLTPKKPLQSLSSETVFYIAAIVSLGTVVYHSGLATLIADTVLAALPLEPNHNASNFGIFSLLSTGLSMLVTLPGTPAILTPMTQDFSNLSGWSLQSVYMTQVIGFSTVIFPYQAPPLVLAMQLGKIPLRDFLRILLPIAALTIIVLLPLDYLWWSLLGMF